MKLLPATGAAVAAYEKQKAETERHQQDEALRKQREEEREAKRRAQEEAARRAKEVAKARRRARQEARRKARAEHRRKIIEEVLAKKPLRPGRYLFNPPPRGTIDGLRFTLTEVDLTTDKMLVHLNVDNSGIDPPSQKPGGEGGTIRFGLVMADGASATYTGIRAKEGALAEKNGSFTFPPVGKRGAFIMEFPRDALQSTFSLVINDQPLFSEINLRQLRFQAF